MATRTKTYTAQPPKAEALAAPEANGQPAPALPDPAPAPGPVQAKFAAARADLAAKLIERDDEIDLALTAVIAREHCSLYGPGGVAKSMLAEAVGRWCEGRVFTALFHKFLSPEEIFGSPEIRRTKDGDGEVTRVCGRNTTDMLPQAHVGVFEEFWHGSPSILRTLMTVLNERYFVNAGVIQPVPLILAIASSNRFPEEPELAALADRFLFRKTVRPIVSQEGRERLLAIPVVGSPAVSRDHTPQFRSTITPAEIDRAHAEATALAFSPEAREAVLAILREIGGEGIFPSPRRQYKSVTAAQAFAYLSGASEVRPEHLEILQHTLWDDPAEQPAKVQQAVMKIANPTAMLVNGLLLEAEQIVANANPRELAQAAVATKKLAEIRKKLGGMDVTNPRVQRAVESVRQQERQIRAAGLAAE